MRELRGVLYKMKRAQPKMEPWGTLQGRGNEGELCGGIPTIDVRDERYQSINQPIKFDL